MIVVVTRFVSLLKSLLRGNVRKVAFLASILILLSALVPVRASMSSLSDFFAPLIQAWSTAIPTSTQTTWDTDSDAYRYPDNDTYSYSDSGADGAGLCTHRQSVHARHFCRADHG